MHMVFDPDTAWAELQARAERLLEHPKDLEPREPIRRYGSILRIWHFPAAGPQTTWTILGPGKKVPPGSLPIVREISWEREADRQRLFCSPGPHATTLISVRVRDARLSDADLRRRLEAGAHLAVPLVACSNTVGVDGDYFGMETYEGSPFVRLQWWGDGPSEWRHFTDWVAELRSFLLRRLDGAE